MDLLLASPFLVSWYTQIATAMTPGSSLSHRPRSPHFRSFTAPRTLVKQLETLRDRRDRENRPLKVFCDFSVSRGSTQRRELIDALHGCPHVDFLERRVSQQAIWELYSQYPLVCRRKETAWTATGHGSCSIWAASSSPEPRR